MSCGGCILWAFDSTQCNDVKHDKDDAGCSDGCACESALADADADKPECIDGRDDEREAVGSGYRGQPRQDGAVDLCYAEEIPGQASNTGPGQLNGDPCKGHQQQSSLSSEAIAKGGQER